MNLRIKELEELIIKYQKEYYNNSSSIPDEVFDALYDELTDLDPTNHVLHKVGEDGISNKVQHIMPMGSLSKARDNEELKDWLKKQDEKELYILQYKLDGSSIELQYKNGNLIKAVTRGDGIVGDDVTHNTIYMNGVIKTLPIPWSGSIRGEVIMMKSIKDEYFPNAANCRNAANGIMKRKDNEKSQFLHVICYDAINDGAFIINNETISISENVKLQFITEKDKLTFLNNNGFITVNFNLVKTNDFDNIYEYIKQMTIKRDSLPFIIDGIVIKINNIDLNDFTNVRPKRHIAYKFPVTIATTKLIDVQWNQKGQTFTPIAHVEPIFIVGTEVKKANLVNIANIKSLKIKIGDTVGISKRGEIIPKIEYVIHSNKNSKEIEPPTICPLCLEKTVITLTDVYCPNDNCPSRLPYLLEKWIQVNEIMYIGPSIIETFIEKGLIKNLPDLYKLTYKNLVDNDFGPVIAKKLIDSIQFSKNKVTLIKLIAGFGIEGIGEVMVKKVVNSGYSTLKKLMNVSIEEISQIDGFSTITSTKLYDGINKYKNDILKLIELGVNIQDIPSNISSPYVFCITGKLNSITRSDAINEIKSIGAIYSPSITRDTTYVITNDENLNSNKLQKANKLMIPIINEKEFLNIIRKMKTKPIRR